MIVICLRLEVFVVRAPFVCAMPSALAYVVVGSQASVLVEDLVEDEQFTGFFLHALKYGIAGQTPT
jgi:hypothetical protein